jgi:hypothetical protein
LRNIFLSALILTFSLSAFASDKFAEVRCTVELQSEGLNGLTSVTKDLVKTVKIRKSLFNGNRKIVRLSETVEFSDSYFVKVELKESIDTILGDSVLEIEGTLLRHRVGNGKIVLGEGFQSIDSNTFFFSNNVNLVINNDYINLSNESSVVKGAFIECSTL